MPGKAPKTRRPVRHVHRHADGSVWARGRMLAGKPHGFWVWFRKNGVRMRSGYFEKGKQTGTWTTYDRKGKAFKVTVMKAGRRTTPRRRKG